MAISWDHRDSTHISPPVLVSLRYDRSLFGYLFDNLRNVDREQRSWKHRVETARRASSTEPPFYFLYIVLLPTPRKIFKQISRQLLKAQCREDSISKCVRPSRGVTSMSYSIWILGMNILRKFHHCFTDSATLLTDGSTRICRICTGFKVWSIPTRTPYCGVFSPGDSERKFALVSMNKSVPVCSQS